MNSKLPFVSIIIPIYNDSKHLKICLQSLEHQTYPKTLYEVIVINNNSTEDIEAVVSQFGQAIVTYEQRRGSYIARNQGISIANGEILAFTDSDCIPSQNWIEKGVEHLLKTPNCGLVAGQINFFFKDPDTQTAAELYDSLVHLQQKRYIEEGNYGATANLFTFQAVFKKVGLFNPDLKSGGDKEWGKRVFAAGYTQIYASDVSIFHPARQSLTELKKKVTRIVEGNYFLSGGSRKPLAIFLWELLRDLKPSFRYLFKILFRQEQNKNRLKLVFCCIYIWLKYVAAWKKMQLYFKHHASRNAELFHFHSK
jgi:glycosyltransferase involved in cell wall biosynthesis